MTTGGEIVYSATLLFIVYDLRYTLSHLARKLRSLFIISGQIVSSVLNRNFLPCLEPKIPGGTGGKQKCYPASIYLFKNSTVETLEKGVKYV